MSRLVAVLIAAPLTLTTLACSHADTTSDPTSQFVGAWRLASWERQLADGTTIHDPRSSGYLIYTDTGYMCYLSMDPNRPAWEDWTSPTPSEALTGISGIGGYCGTWELDTAASAVLHHVEVEKVPNNVGITRKRSYEFRGPDELVLSPDPEGLPPPVVAMRLVWRRAQ